MAADGGLFGRIAIEKGLVSEAQLARALRAQEELGAIGFPKQLGELLVEDGALKPDGVALILRLQEINERAIQDRRFCLLAIKNKLITKTQLDSANERLKDEGFRRSIREVLVENGALEPGQVRAIRLAMERAEKDNVPATGETPVRATARLGATLEIDDETTAAMAGGAELEKRIGDVLFAALAVRDGHVLIPELEHALRDLRYAEGTPLWSVLGARGTLGPAELKEIADTLANARDEKIQIPGYSITGLLGRGATSIVLRAKQDLIDREVAIKLFHADHVAATDARAIVDEARSIAKLKHPNVVAIYDVGRLHRRIYYVMELVDGPTLKDVIEERGFLSEPEALGIAREIALALEAIHDAGLVHRDVKPQNILIGDSGVAKLTDLGLARETGRADAVPGAVVGTPWTIAPELVQGEPPEIRGDIYSLGATLFMTLTGKPPYEGRDAVTVLMGHVSEAVPDPRSARAEIGEGAAALVMSLMAKRREERPETPRDVVEWIDKLLAPVEGEASA